MTVRHFLADDDLTPPAEQEQVLNLAAEMKAEPFKYRPPFEARNRWPS